MNVEENIRDLKGEESPSGFHGWQKLHNYQELIKRGGESNGAFSQGIYGSGYRFCGSGLGAR